MSETVQVTLTKSPIGKHPTHRLTLRALGLRKRGAVRTHALTPSVAGMLKQVGYLIKIEKAK
jgi:large subunit ribosomal protein L30